MPQSGDFLKKEGIRTGRQEIPEGIGVSGLRVTPATVA